MFERKDATPATPGPRDKVHGTFQRVALQGVTRFTVFIGIVLATRTSPRWGTFFQLGAMLVAMGAYAGWTGRGLDSQMLAGGAILITMTGALLSFGAAATVGALQLVQVVAVYRWVLDASGARAPTGDLVAHLLLVLGALVAAWVLSRLMSGALQAALTSRVEIEAVIDEAPVGIATIRLGRFQLVNEQLREMLGASREALVGQPVEAAFLQRLNGPGAHCDRLLERLEADRLLDLDCKLQPPARCRWPTPARRTASGWSRT